MIQNHRLLFVVYDSIFNSVFQSQVLSPLKDRLKKNPDLEICIMSFEKKKLRLKEAVTICDEKHIHFIIKKKYPFLGKFSFAPSVRHLKKFLKKTPVDQIIARGPLAGYITKKAISKLNIKPKFTIQARGLAAEEFRYSNEFKKQNILKKLFNPIRYKQLGKIEQKAYNANTDFEIESVSPALKDYLVETFNADENKITIARHDIPKNINPEQITSWRQEVREELGINPNKKVFVYSGSVRPWQCIPETLDFFKKEYKRNEDSFLLILSCDKVKIEEEIKNAKLQNNSFQILSVEPQDLYRYLSACDVGLLFRKEDIINQVSRPTKMLEYQAVGLEIIHNNTVAWLR